MKYLIILVLLIALSQLISRYIFDNYFKEDIRQFGERMRQAHPEHFKAPEANRLGKGLQHPY